MLENIVAWVLNTYIGEYLEDLNTDHLSVALLSGQLELENVPLKKSALRKLDLPLEVKSGLLGKLTLSIPITHLRSEPWILKLSDVLIVVGPLSPSQRYDVEAVEQVEQQKKETMLDELEQRHKTELLTLLGLPVPPSQDSWWGASLLSTVVNNIQLILNNVHIRYEDGSTLPNGLGFNCGIRMQKITVQTTSPSWKPGFIEPQEGVNIFKKLEVKGFSMYWNSDKQPTTFDSPKMLREILAPETHTNSYIIQPCSTELRMERNSSKFPLRGTHPRFKFFLRPEKITCELTRRQMAELRALNREWARFERARQHRKWRPLTHIGENARDWWRFAYDRVTEEGRYAQSRRTWHFALTRARHLNAYCRAYRRRLLNLIHNPAASEAVVDPSTGQTRSTAAASGASQEDRTVMKQIERDAQYSYHELQLFRETVFRRLMRETEKETGFDSTPLAEDGFESLDSPVEQVTAVEAPKQPDQGIYGWITSFFTPEESKAERDDKMFDFGTLDLSELRTLPESFSVKDMEEEILDVLHESWDDSTLLRRDELLAEVSLRLEQITLRFIDSSIVNGMEQRRVLAMDLSGVTSRVHLSPRQSSFSVQLAVQDMSIQRLRTGHSPMKGQDSGVEESLMYSMEESTKILLAVGRMTAESGSETKEEPIFRMHYRRRSPRLVVRHSVEGRFRPISVMYEEKALDGLSTLFADDPLMFKADSDTDTDVAESVIESHLLVNLHVPKVTVEFRKRSSAANMSPEWEAGEAFAGLSVYDVSFGVKCHERYLTQVKIGIGHTELSDLFERTPLSLLSTGKSLMGQSKPFSNSCPDMTAIDVTDQIIPSSLPNQGYLSNLTAVHTSQRKVSSIEKGSDTRETTIEITLADSRHPRFGNVYKTNCNVELDFNNLEIGMNRRTWTSLLDLLGVLGKEETTETPRPASPDPNVLSTHPREAYHVGCSIRMKSWSIVMQYPSNKTQLGVMRWKNTEIVTTVKLNELTETLAVAFTIEGLSVEDRTPLYSELYPDRIVLMHETGVLPSKAELSVMKYLGEDPSRECDLRVRLVVPSSMHLYYVHTHRFFCGMMDFWMQFFELQDQVAKSKRTHAVDGVQSRVSLDIDVKCSTTIVLPMNQCSKQGVVLESSGLRMTNLFQPMSRVADIFHKNCIETDFGYDDHVDCLLDCARVVLSDLNAFECYRFDAGTHREQAGSRVIGRGVFKEFEFLVSPHCVFSKKFDMSVDLFRNLDGTSSHNAPDLTIITKVRGLQWKMTTDFYILFRGVLEKNLGDPLVTVPETIPLEILQKPTSGCELGSVHKYATLSFRLLFEEVELDCQVPEENGANPAALFCRVFVPFARMQLDSARVSFDVFVDGQSELDLICETTQLIDTRRGQDGRGGNLFTTILKPLDSPPGKKRISLMSEAHLMMKKDEPPALTLVLMNARVLLLPDWLNDAKEFVLLSTDFVPKYSDEPTVSQPTGVGVVERTRVGSGSANTAQTVSLKITLRDSDLYILEDTSLRNSFALVATTTAVLNMNDAGGDISANLEIQNLALSWCSMLSEDHRLRRCSNDFSVGIGLSVGSLPTGSQQKGLPQLSNPRHHAEVEVRGMIGRLSYRDGRVVSTVLTGFMKHVNTSHGRTLIPIITPKPPPKSINIGKLTLKTENADLWLLDDYQGSSIPVLRISLSDVNVSYQPNRIVAALTTSVDYFNQRVFGWEPLVEKWNVLRFLMHTKDRLRTVELLAESRSTLDVNITEQLMQQAVQLSGRWPAIQSALEREDFRSICTQSQSDHLPYLLKNETGCDISFTTAVGDIMSARSAQRKPSVRWINVQKSMEHTFEFPTRLLLYSQKEREPPRQLIVRVAGWDEISPVNVDACGTYFRVVKAMKSNMPNARLVIRVTMEKDGKKVVAVRSSIDISNDLPHTVVVYEEGTNEAIMTVESSACLPVPLQHARSEFLIIPNGAGEVLEKAELSWKRVRVAGEVLNRTQRLEMALKDRCYWMCSAVRREYYPEDESLPGHSICLVSPLSVQNLLPIDMELRIHDHVFAVGAGKTLQITSINITREFQMSVTTDRLTSVEPCNISKTKIGEGLLVLVRLRDSQNRALDMYANVRLGVGGCISISLWVPYWIVNKSGIPLIVKQEAASSEAAGQGEEHERAKDRHPLMFSFADDGCPNLCVVRVGCQLATESGYSPRFSQRFPLAPGVQSLKLKSTHDTLPTQYYNVGVEVRAGTGRYKDTQVVLLTPRFVLDNKSSYNLSICHFDLIDRKSEHVLLASHSRSVWNERVEDQRKLCVRRSDVRHWSCPFRIDRIGSFHVTMRDADETPRFVRVEVTLSSAVFCVIFTDAEYYPAPIRIDNLSDVPVLYQQMSESITGQHLRTICKSRSHVDYAWDDLYGTRMILLQVYENKSHPYDPSMPGTGEPLTYENNMYIQLTASFDSKNKSKQTDERELVLETLQKGKLMLNKQNRMNGNDGNQLWRLCNDGCIENIGMSRRNRGRMVLDVLDKSGNQLMMTARDPKRDRYQTWTMMPDGRLCPQALPQQLVTARNLEVCLAGHDASSTLNEDGVANSQSWKALRQRPGSGKLDVECKHNGPTLVIQITDRDQKVRSASLPVITTTREETLDVSVTMRSGFGISLVNGQYEELLYARLGGIVVHARKVDGSYQMTASVDVIQADNQMLGAERFPVLFCQAEQPPEDEASQIALHDLPPGVPAAARPALKLEMNCLPKKHYDCFECFRLKMCDVSVQLNELLMWKIVQFAQASNAATSVQQKALSLPPNTEVATGDPVRTRRWYFGTLDLEMGQIALSVVTVPKSGLPKECRQLKQQFNVKLVSFENATVSLPPFRQFHYFETSSFLLETLRKFYFAELQKQTLSIVVTLDAFGNPLGLVTDLKDSFQGLFIEGDVQRFVAGLGYGVSNSISKMASSMASGVGALTFDQSHEARRRHNMIRSQSVSSTPLTHLYSGVKGLGMGVFGGVTAILTNTINESKRGGIVSGAFRGITTGAVDTVTKPVQGLFDLVEGTASAMKELAGPAASGTRRTTSIGRVRPPRVCRDLFHLLPPYSLQLATAQMEMLRINGFSPKERLLDVEVCLEQFVGENLIRQYGLISTKQCYICKQVNDEPSNVIQRIVYKYLKSVQPRTELLNNVANIEVVVESDDRKGSRPMLVWCSRVEVARRLADKIMRAKHEYDHSKRTLNERLDQAV